VTSRAGPTELSLIVAAQAGDREALSKLLTPMIDRLVDQIQAKVPPDDASDVVQDALLAVIEALPSLRRPECFRAWVRRIARRQIAHYHRGRRLRLATHLTLLAVLADDSAQMAFDRAEDRALIQTLLAQMTERQQVVIGLRLHEGLTFAQVGERLGITGHAAEDTCWRARSKIGPRARGSRADLPLN
jgi:pectate disaccharide-lyase